jgi:hypothetical protein
MIDTVKLELYKNCQKSILYNTIYNMFYHYQTIIDKNFIDIHNKVNKLDIIVKNHEVKISEFINNQVIKPEIKPEIKQVIKQVKKITIDVTPKKIFTSKNRLIDSLTRGKNVALKWKSGMSKYPCITYVSKDKQWLLQSHRFTITEKFNDLYTCEKYYEDILVKNEITPSDFTRRGYISNETNDNILLLSTVAAVIEEEVVIEEDG